MQGTKLKSIQGQRLCLSVSRKVLVSLAAVLCLVTQRSSPHCGEERCVTILKTAARETRKVSNQPIFLASIDICLGESNVWYRYPPTLPAKFSTWRQDAVSRAGLTRVSNMCFPVRWSTLLQKV